MQLHEEMLFCLHKDETVAIWDLTTRLIVKQIQHRIDRCRKVDVLLLHASKNLLIICNNSISSNRNDELLNVDTLITISRIHNSNEIDVESTEDLVNSKVERSLNRTVNILHYFWEPSPSKSLWLKWNYVQQKISRSFGSWTSFTILLFILAIVVAGWWQMTKKKSNFGMRRL